MITKDNFKELLIFLKFTEIETKPNVYIKSLQNNTIILQADFNKNELIYPEDKGFVINERQTCNFSSPENFVVFECVHRLLEKGYKPEHIELEPKWKLGHNNKSGRADILVKSQEKNEKGEYKPLLLIECKTADKEFKKAWKETLQDGGQLFSYAQQIQETEFLCLYASDFDEKASQIIISQQIISHKDNKDILEQDKSLKSFEKAKDVKERYEVWKNTYKLESTDSGIFEESIQAYQIGKNKYTLDEDTKPLSSVDKKGLYHEFRTILRKHNVSRRENAFDVLVNLFLCKIIDETENKTDLKFRWKGIAYDNYYDLVDRLQGLYQSGMKKFLKEEILYVSNDEIDKAFWATKTNRNATKKRIKEIFRELKFFKGLDFEFIKVHNSKGFDKNAKILIDIIKMWQSVRLTSQNQNQFLGDMFEFFLDNGIKQTEGQFFTPIPICKFIVASLPLETKIKETSEPLKAIDYACGSGHFLTEYATAIKPLIEKHKETTVAQHYQHIYGIEKEDRLAKVATVSAYMYGQQGINVIDADALAHHEALKREAFDVLIANPPFAVDDFLEVLTQNDEKEALTYELFENANIGTNNIQCFFLERTKHLLARNGVAGIIVPTSILSNSDTMHIQTREILLKYFDFVSIVELGSGTFGKTGTNTVVLFLKRKEQRPEQAEHFWNRTLDFFENPEDEIQSNGGMYQDLPTLKKYCQHIEVPFEDYQHVLKAETHKVSKNLIDLVEKYEIFKEYKNTFEKSTEVANLNKKADFKKLSPKAQQEKLDVLLWEYIRKIEQQKVFYFMLAYHNTTKVLVVKSPTDNKEQKQFLGYEWTNSKGQEGIKYNNGETVYDIQTPLFNPKDTNDTSKISYWIAQNFLENNHKTHEISENLVGVATYINLTDLLDFSRKDFNKAISLTPKKNTTIETQWDLVKLGDVVKMKGGDVFKEIYQDGTNKNDIPFFKVSDMNLPENTSKMIIANNYVSEDIITNKIKSTIFPKNTIIFPKVGMTIHTNKKRILEIPACIDNNIMGMIIINNKILHSYLYEYFISFINLSEIASGGNPPSISAENANEIKIPLPPLEVQEKIVNECEAIDQATENAQKEIETAKTEIEEKILDVFGKYPEKKISEIAFINPSKSEIKNVDEDTLISFIEMASVSDEGFIANKVDKPLKDLKKGSYTYFAENDIIVAKITPCMENGKCALAKGLTNGLAMGSTEFHVFRTKENINNKYLFILLNREVVRKEAEQNFTGSSGHRRVPASFYESYKIPVPDDINIQNQLVLEIEVLEKQIAQNQEIIKQAPQAKQSVLKKYL
ncbi:MAG: restriction endonuclease subunit S [Raineya sp.]|jgi:type I restriction-modification system DNA methylase subunit/restriction endonuclease S subunit|nr:restriction endonuclease subunit S [Raineya sp.]